MNIEKVFVGLGLLISSFIFTLFMCDCFTGSEMIFDIDVFCFWDTLSFGFMVLTVPVIICFLLGKCINSMMRGFDEIN